MSSCSPQLRTWLVILDMLFMFGKRVYHPFFICCLPSLAVYCEACISPHDNVFKCPNCESTHPNGFPNVCLVLEHFLEKHFPDEYSARRESLSNFQNVNTSQGLLQSRYLVSLNKNIQASEVFYAIQSQDSMHSFNIQTPDTANITSPLLSL